MLQYRVTTNRARLRHTFKADHVKFIGWPHMITVRPGDKGPVLFSGDLFSADRLIAKIGWGIPSDTSGPHCFSIDRDNSEMAWAVNDAELRCLIAASDFRLALTTSNVPFGDFSVHGSDVFAIAGVYVPPTRGKPGGFAVMTCEPTETLAEAGAKTMPVVLDQTAQSLWVSGDLDQPRSLLCPNSLVDQKVRPGC